MMATAGADDKRAHLLQRCALNDIDVLMRFRYGHSYATAVRRAPPSWPRLGYSCDFCESWTARVGQCPTCMRWLGLSDCKCASPASMVVGARSATSTATSDTTTTHPFGGFRLQEIVEHNRRQCQWCAARLTESAPAPCGFRTGLLRCVVFVLEPVQAGRWQFGVGRRMLENVLENTGAGSFLLYALESGDEEREWLDAFACIRRFCAAPHDYLPLNCLLDPRGCVVVVLLATHSMQRADDDAVSLELCNGTSRSLAWWCNKLDQQMFGARNDDGEEDEWNDDAQQQPSSSLSTKSCFNIAELFVVSCDLFPQGSRSSETSRRFRSLADKHNVAISVCDGHPRLFAQVRKERWAEGQVGGVAREIIY